MATQLIVRGIAFWTFLNKHNPMKDLYSIDVGRLSSETVKKCEEMGYPVHTCNLDPEDANYRGRYIKCTNGFKKAKPELVDSQRRVLDVGSVLIGNGSEVNVLTSPYEWTYPRNPKPKQKVQKGTKATFTKVQLINLIPYKGNDFEEIADGYIAAEDALQDNASKSDEEAEDLVSQAMEDTADDAVELNDELPIIEENEELLIED